MTRLWRLTRTGQTALDGAGTLKHGGRYSPRGAPVVNFASEAGLAVLVALRYLHAIRDWVTDRLQERRSLPVAVRSQVLPDADVVLMNALHPAAANVQPLVARPFSFAECLHTPPMLARYAGEGGTAT